MLATAGGIHLLPNWTIFVQLGIFIVALIIIKVFMLEPALRVISLRRAYSEGAKREAELLEDKARDLDERRQSILKKEIDESQLIRSESVATANIAHTSILRAAREDVKKLFESSAISIDSSEKTIHEAMEKKADDLAGEIVARITMSA